MRLYSTALNAHVQLCAYMAVNYGVHACSVCHLHGGSSLRMHSKVLCTVEQLGAATLA